jgi:predicted outer membrane repeat protein
LQQIQVSNPVAPNFTCQVIPYPVVNQSDLNTAINNANNDTVCPGSDVIDLGGNTVTLGSELNYDITSSVTIQNGRIERDPGAATNFRLLYFNAPNETLNLNNLELVGGTGFFGAALYAINGYVNIQNSVIRNNDSEYGAVRAFGLSTRIAISQTRFAFNTSALRGAALALGNGTEAYVVDSVFENNTTSNTANTAQGGAIHTANNTRLMMINVVLRGNQAYDGGAIYSGGGTDLINVLMSGNLAEHYGGALYVADDIDVSIDLELLNVTMAGNVAENVSGGGGIRMQGGDADVDNSILWGNVSGSIGGTANANTVVNTTGGATIGFDTSILEGGVPVGATNDDINYYTDPLFIDPVTPTTSNMPNTAGNYRIGSSTSETIDNGENLDTAGGRTISSVEDDLDGNERIQNSNVDLGPYESSLYLGPGPDVNANGIVTPVDAMYVQNRIGTSDLTADVDGDGDVDNVDFQAVLNALGQ